MRLNDFDPEFSVKEEWGGCCILHIYAQCLSLWSSRYLYCNSLMYFFYFTWTLECRCIFKSFLFMIFILVCAAVYRARFKATWKLKSVLQMHLHRCHVLILFVLFKSIYMVTYQNLISSRISQQGQGERESREVMVPISSNLLTVIPLQSLFVVIALLLNLTP